MSLKHMWWIRIVILVVLLAASAVLTLHRAPTVRVTSAAITRGSIVHTVVATGDLRALDTVPVGAEVSGTVVQVFVDYNSIVHAGQPLAKIEPTLFEAELREEQARLASAEAERLQAQAKEME